MLQPLGYAKYFGFTDDEVKELVKNYNTTLTYEELKKWYGYKLKRADICNPYSVLRAITTNQTSCFFNDIKNYEDPFKLITMKDYGLYNDLLRLLDGEKIPFNSFTFQDRITQISSRGDVYCLLVCFGFLASCDVPNDYKKEIDYLDKITKYGVKFYDKLAFIPNKEIMTILEEFTKSDSFKETLELINCAKEITYAITQMEEETVANSLTKYYLKNNEGLVKASNNKTLRSSLKKGFITFLKPYTENLYALNEGFDGLFDDGIIFYFPLPRTNLKTSFPIIIKFMINQSAKEALNKIKAKNYYEEYHSICNDLIFVGINYSTMEKECECKIAKYSTLISEENLK